MDNITKSCIDKILYKIEKKKELRNVLKTKGVSKIEISKILRNDILFFQNYIELILMEENKKC